MDARSRKAMLMKSMCLCRSFFGGFCSFIDVGEGWLGTQTLARMSRIASIIVMVDICSFLFLA